MNRNGIGLLNVYSSLGRHLRRQQDISVNIQYPSHGPHSQDQEGQHQPTNRNSPSGQRRRDRRAAEIKAAAERKAADERHNASDKEEAGEELDAGAGLLESSCFTC
jgi:hypothetical protein